VLICPGCQAGRDWAADLDRCGRCGTARLVRRLGEVECRDCGQVGEPAEVAEVAEVAGLAGPAVAAGLSEGALSEEVARALERVLGPSGRRANAR
jgi:hypothetical protein